MFEKLKSGTFKIDFCSTCPSRPEILVRDDSSLTSVQGWWGSLLIRLRMDVKSNFWNHRWNLCKSADNVFVESFKTHLEHLDSDTMVTPSLGDIVTDSIIFHRWNHVFSNFHHHDQIPSKNSNFHFNDFLITLARSILLYCFRNNQRNEIFENFFQNFRRW